jgi:hypothetical protein
MDTKRSLKLGFAPVVALCLQVVFASSAFTQAFVPFKGEGNYYFGFQNWFTKEHFASDGSRFDAGRIQENAIMQGVDYGLTPKLALGVGLPYVFAKYVSPLEPRKYNRQRELPRNRLRFPLHCAIQSRDASVGHHSFHRRDHSEPRL